MKVISAFIVGMACLMTVMMPHPHCRADENAVSSGALTKVRMAPFGQLPDGREVSLFTLTNANGMEAKIITFGAIVQSLKVPDRDGNLADVVLGFDGLEGYVAEHPYFGGIVGRYGNRIAGGKFTLDDKEYTLAINNPPNALHGGLNGFDKQLWTATPLDDGVKLELVSPDGDEGYPGALTVAVTYQLTDNNDLRIHYEATTDAPTVVNLTNHSYFNLDGAGAGDILEHTVMINADKFTPVDETLIPTGELRPVKGTPFDFRTPKPLSRDISLYDEQLRFGLGYDHNFVLNKEAPDALALAARVYSSTSGRVMEVFTTEPGMQFYSGNFLDGSNIGKGDVVYEHRFGFCMETQHFPDSPNQPGFPSTALRPGDTYESTTIYKFSTK